MKNTSIWKNDKKLLSYNNEISSTDILIIGGGITGLTCAYLLKDTNYKIALIDKSEITMGVTSKTTAKISFLQQTIYQDLEKEFGYSKSYQYLSSQLDAIDIINDIIKKNNIECDFEKVNSILFSKDNKNKEKIIKEKKILKGMGIKVKTINDKFLGFGISVDNTFTFNPLKYLNGIIDIIKDKIDISENTIAKSIKKKNKYYEIVTNKETIKAKIVIVACHYPFFIIPSFIPFKTYIKREYVAAAKYKHNTNYTATNVDKKLQSIRFYNDYLMYGSNNHKLTSKTDYEKNYQKAELDFYELFETRCEYIWMNQDIVSHDKLPFIGRIDKNLYLATAYNAWGMTNGTIAAKVIKDLIINNYSRYKELFNPKRINAPLIINSFLGSFSYLKVYIKGLFKKNNPYYIKIKNIVYGVYKDKNNNKHYIKLLCPHMKCSLIFNKEEKTWDCPCHGSRFDIDGKLLEGPAKENLKSQKD